MTSRSHYFSLFYSNCWSHRPLIFRFQQYKKTMTAINEIKNANKQLSSIPCNDIIACFFLFQCCCWLTFARCSKTLNYFFSQKAIFYTGQKVSSYYYNSREDWVREDGLYCLTPVVWFHFGRCLLSIHWGRGNHLRIDMNRQSSKKNFLQEYV